MSIPPKATEHTAPGDRVYRHRRLLRAELDSEALKGITTLKGREGGKNAANGSKYGILLDFGLSEN